MSPHELSRERTIETWMTFLHDQAALLQHPSTNHKTLLLQTHELHRAQLIDRNDLGDLLELADSALASAVETRLEESGNV